MPHVTVSESVIKLSGDIRLGDITSLERDLARIIAESEKPEVELDASGIETLDSAGAILLDEIARTGLDTGKKVLVVGLKPRLEEQVASVSSASSPVADEKVQKPRRDRFYMWYDGFERGIITVIILMADVFYWSVRDLFRKGQMRRGSFITQSYLIGAQSVPIIATILFLIGFVSALQSSAQLRQFGADIYVANLLAIGICRELGPLMTAIIVSGRSGSAIAAEIATMKFSEEIDALKSMGLNPLRFVVVPKFWAMTLTVPFLTLIANFVGIAGGFLMSIALLGTPPQAFLQQILESLLFKDIATGLVKSVSFAWIITLTAVYRGLSHRGGAEGVGLATTSSVVTSIFAIIVADSFWGIVFYYR